jgi:lauroyl/myristoyl acyltransferase
VSRTDPAFLIYRFGRALTSVLPEQITFGLSSFAGDAIARLSQGQRAVVRRNLARVVEASKLEATVDEAFRSYARYWVETLRIPSPGSDEIRRRTTVEGIEGMAKHLDAGRGVIFVVPHLGSYDVAGAWVASHGWKVIAIAEEIEPPELFEMFTRMRASVGVEVLPVGKGSSARALLNGLRNGAAVGLVADRDISGSGIEVEFFGEKTLIPNGPAVLALRTGAPIAVGALYQRPGGRYHGVVLDPIEVEAGKADADRVRDITEQIVAKMEELIRREPGQWHLFQPNWPSDPGYRHM